MINIKKLNDVKNKIIDKMVSISNIEKTKSNFIFKGSMFEEFLKDPKMKNTTIGTGICLFLSLVTLAIALPIDLKFGIGMFLFNIGLASPIILVFLVDYFSFKKNIIKHNEYLLKKLNPEKLHEIKKNITKDFNENEVKMLLDGNLNKKDLEEVFKSINETIGKEELINVFKKLGLAKKEQDISDPYVLIKTIEKAIEDIKIKESEKMNNENKFIKKNEKIIDSFMKEENKKIEIVA